MGTLKPIAEAAVKPDDKALLRLPEAEGPLSVERARRSPFDERRVQAAATGEMAAEVAATERRLAEARERADALQAQLSTFFSDAISRYRQDPQSYLRYLHADESLLDRLRYECVNVRGHITRVIDVEDAQGQSSSFDYGRFEHGGDLADRTVLDLYINGDGVERQVANEAMNALWAFGLWVPRPAESPAEKVAMYAAVFDSLTGHDVYAAVPPLSAGTRNVLGIAPTTPGIQQDLETLSGAFNGALAHLTSPDTHPDREQVIAMRGWRPDRDPSLPTSLHAGEVASVRYGFAAAAADSFRQSDVGDELALQQVGWMLEAHPYFVPGAAMQMLLAEPPAQELLDDAKMLHDQMLVVFGQPLEVDVSDPRNRLVPPCSIGHSGFPQLPGMLVRVGTSDRVTLLGMVLTADERQHPRDVVGWVLACQSTFGTSVLCLPGRLSESSVRGLVDNALVVIDFASWQTPDTVTLPDGGKARKKALKSSSVRKQLERGGGLPRLQVMNLERTAERTSTPAEGSGTTRPHARRGHWRRVRCGPREDWWYEARFILPVIVNEDRLDGPLGPTERVLRVPEDAAAGAVSSAG